MDTVLQEAQRRIFVALDVNTLDEATQLARELAPQVGGFKVASRLVTAVGAPAVIQAIRRFGGRVILDLKFADIPDQMEGAAGSTADLRADMFTIHASAGIDSMTAAVRRRGSSQVLAVTVLTSFDEPNGTLTFGVPPRAMVLKFARDAKLAGVDGIVCSGQELSLLVARPELEGLLYAIPGIRPEWAQKGDQQRTITPGEAVKSGARIVIIGRPILRPPSAIGTPLAAINRITEEIATALREKGSPTTEEEVLGLLAEAGAVLSGHFIYASGKHGDTYVNKDLVTAHPKITSRICRAMAELARPHDVDVIVGPALGGIVFAHWVAEMYGQMVNRDILAVYAEKSPDGKTPTLSRGFGELVRGMRVGLVEDVLTTGGSAAAVAKAVREAGGDPKFLIAMWNRGLVPANDVGVPELYALVNKPLTAWDAADCPLCAQGIPINTSVGRGKLLAKS